jgi:hypothetical protein
MSKFLKVILIAIAFFITGGLITILKGGSEHGVGGPVGIIILFAFMAGARAIWKYRPESEISKTINNQDSHKLDKN